MYYLNSAAFRTISNAIISNSNCVNLSVLEAASDQNMIKRDPITTDSYIKTSDLQLIADTYSNIGDIRAIA